MDAKKVKEIENKVDELATQARLDKLSLTNIRLDLIEFPEELEKKSYLINGKNDFKFTTLNGERFTNLSITDDEFGSIKFGINFAKKHEYSKLNTSVKNDIGSNIICNSVQDYQKQLERTKEYLIDQYGIHVDFDDAILNSLEINKTFAIKDDITAYRRVLQLVANNVPKNKKMNQVSIFGKKADGLEAETFVVTSRRSRVGKSGKTSKSKQYEELVIYSKSNQIEKIISLQKEFLRIEIKIVSSAKIKKMFGINRFSQFSNEKINEFFNQEVKELIIDPFEKWQENRNEKVLKIMQKQRLQDSQNWVVNTLLTILNEEIKNNVPVILDVSEILPLINQLNIEDKSRRYKIRENFKAQAKKRANVLCNNDHLKMLEIINNLQKKENKMVSPLLDDNCKKMENNSHHGDTIKTA